MIIRTRVIPLLLLPLVLLLLLLALAPTVQAATVCPGLVQPAPGGARVDPCYNNQRTSGLDVGAASYFLLNDLGYYPKPWNSTTSYAYRTPYDVCNEYTKATNGQGPGTGLVCTGQADTTSTTVLSSSRIHVVVERYWPPGLGLPGRVCVFEGTVSGSNAHPYINGNVDPLAKLDFCGAY